MWLPACLASFTVGSAVVTPKHHTCGWSRAWAAAISPRQLGFVVFQTGNPNASSYGIQILYEIPRVEPRPGLAQANPGFYSGEGDCRSLWTKGDF